MKLAIHQPQFMPWVGYFHKMASADHFVLLDNVQFKKNEWQHRNRIRTHNGWQWLSVPTGYRYPQAINEVSVNLGIPWREKHLKSLDINYGRAPFYAEYRKSLAEFYAQNWPTIDLWNNASVRLCAEWFGITVPVSLASQLSGEGTSTARLVSICRELGADTYLAGSGGHDYMDLALFDNAGIRVVFQEFIPPVYVQHGTAPGSSFVPGLSALDIIFNCGPVSRSVLMGAAA